MIHVQVILLQHTEKLLFALMLRQMNGAKYENGFYHLSWQAVFFEFLVDIEFIQHVPCSLRKTYFSLLSFEVNDFLKSSSFFKKEFIGIIPSFLLFVVNDSDSFILITDFEKSIHDHYIFTNSPRCIPV